MRSHAAGRITIKPLISGRVTPHSRQLVVQPCSRHENKPVWHECKLNNIQSTNSNFGHGLKSKLMEELARLGDPAATKGRVILAHLGNGASLAAVSDGKSIDTSMGFTPPAGLVMSTRSGDLDPGLAPYLARTEHMTTQQFYDMVMVLPGLTCPPHQEVKEVGVGEQQYQVRLSDRQPDEEQDIDEVADITVKSLWRTVPAAVPGIAFLSGGQSAELASARLNLMNLRFKSQLPWGLSFSFARAIQQPALEIWRGQEANVKGAQQALLHRARCNRAARRGEYTAAMEKIG
jgi:hypothetical protein